MGIKGQIPWNKGIKTGPLSEETKSRMSESHKGTKKPWAKNNGKKYWFKKGESSWNKGINGEKSHSHGRKQSEESKEKMKASIKEHYDKVGRKSTKNKLMRKSTEFKNWIEKVFERDNYKCQKCQSNKDLHPHHIKKLSEFPELSYDVSNGQTLCAKCHGEIHGIPYSKMGKYLTCKNCKIRFRPKSGHLKQMTCSKKCGYEYRSILKENATGKKGVKL